MAMRLSYRNYSSLDDVEKVNQIIQRSELRDEYYKRLLKFVAVCYQRNIRMIFENPYTTDTFLKANFLKNPDIVDNNRMLRGDYFVKPTAYWFWNCTPTYGFTEQYDKKHKSLMLAKKAPKAGMCSEERSMISPDYARNFICDFIIGKEQIGTQLSLYDTEAS